MILRRVKSKYAHSAGVANLPLFLSFAKEAGLYVNLRLGPYVCTI